MGFQVCVLASGSSGNSIFVGNDDTRILIDAGLSCKEICNRLSCIDIHPESIHGLCVTHEHSDHHIGLPVLHRKYGMSLFGNTGTVERIGSSAKAAGLAWNIFTTGQPFRIGSLTVEPFMIPHDSEDPVAFIVRDETTKIGICTDLGVSTDLVREKLRDCDLIVLEANHDEEMLLASSRPWPLKQRILGPRGHLSNRHAAELLCAVASDRLAAVFMAHLSQDCNRQSLAEETIRHQMERAGFGHVRLYETFVDKVSCIWSPPDTSHPEQDVEVVQGRAVHLELC